MAIDLTLKSIGLTNREATPRVLNNPGLAVGAVEKCAFDGVLSVPASLSATSVIRCVQVPSNCIVTDIRFTSGAQAAGAGDIGVYRNNANGGLVIDADFFASAVAVTAASLNVDVLGESTVNTFTKQRQPLWQALGLTADPKQDFDLAFTVTTDITTGLQPLALRVRFVQ